MSLVVAGVLARLIPPEEFGVIAIATVIISFFSIFTDMGVSPAIVQNKELTQRDLSGIFSFTIWSGIAIAALFFAASWPIAEYYDRPILRTLCQILSINLLFASANIVPNALISKNKEFKFIALRSFSIQLVGGVASVIAAFCGAGLYALIINPILSSMLLFAVSIRRYPQQLRLTWGGEAIHKIFSYSAYQFLFNIINYFSRNLDKLLIGKYMGMAPLGYYEKSYRLMMLPLQNITYVITPVMHPIFSDYQNDPERLCSSYERIVRLLAFLGFPLSVLLLFTAKEITLVVFGQQWLPSVDVFQILSLSVGLQIILSSSGSIFQASGDTRSLFICGLFSSAFNVGGILLGIFYFETLTAVAWCICAASAANFAQCYWLMYRATFKRSMLPFVRQLLSPLVLSALVAGALFFLSLWLDGMNIFLTGMVKGMAFFCIFGVYIQTTKEMDLWGRVKGILAKRKRN